jgi:hypothetical protein
MNFETIVADLSSERIIEFGSAEENEEFLLHLGVNQEMRQLRRGSFQSALATRSTESADLYADRFSVACRMYLESPSGMVGLVWLRSAGVRTLQRCIRAYFDVTVTEFLESVRLATAHRELSVLNPSDTTVTCIALNNAFSHLGRFSTAYRQRYGIKPSEQLSRQPGQKS